MKFILIFLFTTASTAAAFYVELDAPGANIITVGKDPSTPGGMSANSIHLFQNIGVP